MGQYWIWNFTSIHFHRQSQNMIIQFTWCLFIFIIMVKFYSYWFPAVLRYPEVDGKASYNLPEIIHCTFPKMYESSASAEFIF